MSAPLRALLVVFAWLATVTFLHLRLNTHVLDSASMRTSQTETRFRVGFLPVT
jgi:hypothetical protein